MPLEQLLTTLRAEATRGVEATLAAATAEAEAIRAAARSRRERQKEGHLAEAEAEARERHAAELGAALQRARADRLLALRRVVERVLAEAEAALGAAAESPQYMRQLPRRLAAALALVDDADAVVRCPGALAEPLRRAAAEGGCDGVDVRADAAVGAGFRVAARGGALVVDETLAARLRQLRPRLEQEVARLLESGGVA